MSGYDLSRLYILIEECPKGVRLADWSPELGAYPEFHVADENRVKIAILSGDVDSPFVRIRDRETMIRAIFDHLGIDHQKEQMFFNNVVKYRDDLTVNAWLRYLQVLHETDFTNWQITKKDYEFFLMKANEDQGDKEDDLKYYKKRNEIRERIKELAKELKETEAILFPDSKAAREAAAAEAKRKISLYAEKYSEPYSFK